MASGRRCIVIYRQGSSDVVHFDKDLIERQLNPSEGEQFYENWQATAVVVFDFDDAELRSHDEIGSYLYFSPPLEPITYHPLSADDCLDRNDLEHYPIKIHRI